MKFPPWDFLSRLNCPALSQPVCKKHGKLITFLRTFMKSRPPPQKLRQRGILRERVFGCDLGEHLHNSGHEGKAAVRLRPRGFRERLAPG